MQFRSLEFSKLPGPHGKHQPAANNCKAAPNALLFGSSIFGDTLQVFPPRPLAISTLWEYLPTMVNIIIHRLGDISGLQTVLLLSDKKMDF